MSVRRWTAAILPALLLRSLIPVGFMPEFGPGLSVRLMLCPAYAPSSTARSSAPDRPDASADPSTDMSVGMDMSMDMSESATGNVTEINGRAGSGRAPVGGPGGQDHSSCPYAASATLAGAPAVSCVRAAEPSIPLLALPLAQVSHCTRVARAQSARAPPIAA